ncbi:serine hydrolase domain-containing protein [Nocardia heshunensis]
MRQRLPLMLGVATLLLTACGVAGPTPISLAERLRRDAEAIHALGISGVQARTITADGTELITISGNADPATAAPIDPDGYFRMASTAKTLLATVVLQLDAEGTLHLDDTLARWLPEALRGSAIDADHITVRQLLQHTSGIHDDLPGYTTPAEYYQQRHDIYTSQQLLARAAAHAPDFAPGAGWAYSNTGYVLLGMIIERATSRTSHREIQDRILTPLAMTRTHWLGTSPTLPDPHARAYQFFGPGSELDVTDQIAVDPDILSWVTTTRDENTFFRALLSGRLLPAAQLTAMKHTLPVSADLQQLWPSGRYGLGLAERPLSCGGAYFTHEGGDGGYITLNGVTPDATRSTVLSMSEALGDTPTHILAQESAASTFIDHALCSRDLNPTK